MIASFWAKRSVPLLFVPTGAVGEHIQQLAREWTKSGILGPSIWINHGQFANNPELTTIEASLMYSPQVGVLKEDTEPSLLKYLTRNEIQVLRTVSIRVASQESSVMPEIELSVNRVADLLKRSLALQDVSSSARENNSNILKYDLLVYPSNHKFSQPTSASWPITVVASPEDRRTPWAIDSFVSSENIIPFSLSSLATVAGLWSGIAEGSLDHLSRQFSNPGKVVVMRPFVRAITSDGMARRLSAQVLKMLANPKFEVVEALGVSGNSIYSIPHSEFEARIDGMVATTYNFSEKRLQWNKQSISPVDLTKRISIFRQVLFFFQFSIDRLLRIPKWTWLGVQRFVAKRLRKSLYGKRSSVIIGPDDERAYDGKDRTIRRLHLQLTEIIKNFNAKSVMQNPNRLNRLVDSRLYSEIRRLIFAMSDGSDVPSAAAEVGYQGKDRVIFSKVDDFLINYEAADSESIWHWKNGAKFSEFINAKLAQGWDSIDLMTLNNVARLPKIMQDCEQILTSKIQSLEQQSLEQTHDDQADFETSPQVERPQEDNSRTTVATLQDKIDSSSAGTSRAKMRVFPGELDSEASNTVNEPEVELPTLQILLEELRVDLESLNNWKAKFEGLYNWKLAFAMESDEILIETEESQLLERIKVIETAPTNILLDLRNKFLRGFWRSLTLASILPFIVNLLLSMAGSLVAGIFSFLFGATLAQIVLWIVGLWLLNLLRLLVKYHRDWREYSEDITRAEIEYRQLIDRITYLRTERPQMVQTHSNVKEWLFLLSLSIQKPYEVADAWAEEGNDSHESIFRPEALRIAQAIDDAGPAMERLKRFAMSKQCLIGFRGEIYQRQVRTVRDLKNYQDSEFSEEILDRDDATFSNQARKTFLNVLFENEPAVEHDKPLLGIGRNLMRNLIKQIQIEGLKESQPKVMPDDVDSRGLRIKEQAFESTENYGSIEWDEFLLGAVGSKNDPVPPFQPTTFSEVGQIEEIHANVEVVLQVPNRVKDIALQIAKPDFEIIDYTPLQISQAEVLCRTDYKVVELDFVSVFSNTDSAFDQNGSIDASRTLIPRCPKCGSEVCPAANPQFGAACTNSGI